MCVCVCTAWCVSKQSNDGLPMILGKTSSLWLDFVRSIINRRYHFCVSFWLVRKEEGGSDFRSGVCVCVHGVVCFETEQRRSAYGLV